MQTDCRAESSLSMYPALIASKHCIFHEKRKAWQNYSRRSRSVTYIFAPAQWRTPYIIQEERDLSEHDQPVLLPSWQKLLSIQYEK